MKFLKLILYVLIIGLIAAGTYFGYRFYSQAKEEAIDALYLIPENAAVVFYSADFNELQAKLQESSSIWSNLTADPDFKKSFQNTDSLYSQINGILNVPKINAVKIYYSIHFIGYKKFANLLSFSTDQLVSSAQFEKDLVQFGKFTQRKFEGEQIYEITSKVDTEKYYLVMLHGVFSMSNSGSLIEKIILESNLKSTAKKLNVDRMLKIAGKNEAATIFVNYQYMYRLIADFARNEDINLVKQIGDLSQFTVLDFNPSKSHFNFSGYTFSSDTVASLLNGFKEFKPTTIEIFDHIPAQTSFIYYQGAEQINTYLTQRSTSKFNVENERAIKSYQADLMIDMRNYFYPWIKSELAFCKLYSNEKDQESFAIMDTYDPKEAIQSLSKLELMASEFKAVEVDTIFYRTFEIHHIPLTYLIPNIFGTIFSSLEQTYYVLVDDYVVFANSAEILKKYIDNILIKKTLSEREGFSEFKAKISMESHIMIYTNMHAFDQTVKPYLNNEIVNKLSESSINLSELGDAAIQYIVGDNGAYTTININKTEWDENEDEVSWQVALDFPLAKGPFVVANHQTKKNDIMVFDERNMMYRINHLGKILWAIPVAELPIGDVQSIDFYKNGKLQIIYNSAKYLYMYDLNGNKVENYPIMLNSDATASLNVVDYDHNLNYRIIVPQKDKIIHNYKIEGIETEGWKMPTMPAIVNNAVQYFRLGTKDFLLLADTLGNVVFSNRKGESRIEAKLAFTNNPKTPFYQMGNQLVTTDLIGRIILIDQNGQVTKFLLRDFTENHYFKLMDVNFDGQNDFFFYDENNIFSYSQNRELLWTFTVDNMRFSDFKSLNYLLEDSTKIMTYSYGNKQFMFMNSKGRMTIKDEYTASDHFVVYKSANGDANRLVSGKERVISNYLIK